MAARILAVEDDQLQARLLEMQLRNEHQVTVTGNGEDCLAAAAAGEFDVILLDVMLPGISGYEVCRRLKAGPATRDIPVLFVSANFSMDDRLQGFEAGGFDYLVKPVVKAELTKKIDLLLAHQEERRHLQYRADFATSTAMTAMTSAAELGLVLQFMKRSFACKTYPDLADAMIATARQFGVEPLVQIRGHFDSVCRGPDGPCTPLESSILANFAGGDRIVDLKSRTAISYERATLLLTGMPTDDTERYGRIKDHLTTLLEGVDARVQSLDLDIFVGQEAQRTFDTVQDISRKLLEASRYTQDLRVAFGASFNRMIGDLETTLPLLELSASQEAMVENLIHRASTEYVALADQEKALERALLDSVETLQQVAHQTGQAP